MTTLEIAIETYEDALAAQRGGADSVELSHDLAQDGLTPDRERVAKIRDAVTIALHVIVRPHNRGFVYSEAEFEMILRDAENFVQLGVDGIVFGAHRADESLDVAMIQAVAGVTQDKVFTLHRAIDRANNPEAGLTQLTNVIDRVLTSGPASSAWAGRHGLKQWQATFGEHLDFIAAGSIRAHMLPELITYTGVSGIHVGSAARAGGVVNADTIQRLKATFS